MTRVSVIGAGLAGSEAAYQLACRGIDVDLYEMRPAKNTPVHHTGNFAELVCSNSLKSLDMCSAAGTLKYEIAILGSTLIRQADKAQVPAGKALAVDRDIFSSNITKTLKNHQNINVIEEEITNIPNGPAIIATGPLTSDSLAEAIKSELGSNFLSFFDAAAPIISADSIDFDKVFAQSRYGKGGGDDYLNAPFDKQEYESFVKELVFADKVILKDFEKKELFSACQPVEEVARSGVDALSHGALKPTGLTDPKTEKRPWAVVQLRAENKECSAYNLVGFQTNLKFSEQERVFKMIPGLENAEFLRYGVMHRNTFINSPVALGSTFEIPSKQNIRFAGQITGTEGYCEAIASGLFAALATYAEIKGIDFPPIPKETLFGALVSYATNPDTTKYQPMHVNFGLVPPLKAPVKSKKKRYEAYCQRARNAINEYENTLCELGLIDYDFSEEMHRIKEIPLIIEKYMQEQTDEL